MDFLGHYPLDNVVNFNQDKHKIAQEIFVANDKLIDECDIVVANLNLFHGKEADSGTIWEVWLRYAKEKGFMDIWTVQETTLLNFLMQKKKKVFLG